jgi:hypothetical protein
MLLGGRHSQQLVGGEESMRMRIKLVAIAAVCLVAGCATAYQPDGIGGGYADRRLSENTAQVSFRGNRLTQPETLHSYLLRRCADVTLQDGYSYFVLVSSEPPNERSTDVFGSQEDSASIKMFKDNKPASAYDAAAVVRGLAVEGEMAEGALPPPAVSVSSVGRKVILNPNAPTNEPPSFENMY